MPPKHAFNLETLSETLPRIFDQAQVSAATHKKNCVTLFKLHAGAASIVETIPRGNKRPDVKLSGEKAFIDIILDMVNRVMVSKKGPPAADRIIRFIGTYARFLNERMLGGDSTLTSAADLGDGEAPASRFISKLLKHLLKAFGAKSRTVRFRAVSIVAEIVGHLGEIDEDLYEELRSSLLERLKDKESPVRTFSVIALCKLAVSEDPQDLDKGEQPILISVLDMLCCDPAPEVRRAALIHIPMASQILPTVLTRARDVDAVTRKLVYTSLLPRLKHPKMLTIAQREFVVGQGLGDREEAVRVAAAKMLRAWLDLCQGDLVEFLKIFDVLTGEIAADVLKSIFASSSDILDEVELNDTFWTNLRPETALLARVFVGHCIATKDEARLETVLPVVTAMAFHVQNKYNTLLELVQEAEGTRLVTENDDDADAVEEQVAETEFIIAELLRLALHMDFGDEIGRRKMFNIIRDMIAHASLPDSLIKPCLGVLEVLSPNERDLVRLVVEIINEIRDVPDNEDGDNDLLAEGSLADTTNQTARPLRSTKELTTDERLRTDLTDLRCMDICIGMLEKVNGSFEENSTLEGILGDLIIPAVKRKELLLREKGLVCLGLCCLIARNLALSSFQLFLSQIKSAPEGLKLRVLHVVFDVMMTYEKEFLRDDVGERIIAFLMQVLETEESLPVQALLCLGLSKLMLFGLVMDERVLTSLVLAFVSPVTADNQELRQCLAYFLPAYCYSSPANQSRMQSIFITAYDLVSHVYENMDDDQDMVAPLHFGQLFVDWTNPQNVVSVGKAQDADQSIHIGLAIDILRALYDSERTSEDKKTLCQLLPKLNLPERVDQRLLYNLNILVLNLQDQCPLEDPATEKVFFRFKTLVAKHFAGQLKGFDEKACFKDDTFRELFEFIGVVAPKVHEATSDLSESEQDAPGPFKATKTHGPKRSLSPKESQEASEAGADTDHQSEAPSADELQDSRPPSPSPLPKSKGKVQGKVVDQLVDSDPESPESIPASPTPLRKKGKAPAAKGQVKEGIMGKRASPAITTHHPESSPSEKSPKENHRQSSTPTRRRGVKRIRSPAKDPLSPAHKRPARAAKKRSELSKKQVPEEVFKPLSNSTNSSTHSTSSAGKQRVGLRSVSATSSAAPSNLRGRRAMPNSGDESEQDNPVSDASEPDILATKPRHARPTFVEKIGWDDSSDI